MYTEIEGTIDSEKSQEVPKNAKIVVTYKTTFISSRAKAKQPVGNEKENNKDSTANSSLEPFPDEFDPDATVSIQVPTASNVPAPRNTRESPAVAGDGETRATDSGQKKVQVARNVKSVDIQLIYKQGRWTLASDIEDEYLAHNVEFAIMVQ